MAMMLLVAIETFFFSQLLQTSLLQCLWVVQQQRAVLDSDIRNFLFRRIEGQIARLVALVVMLWRCWERLLYRRWLHDNWVAINRRLESIAGQSRIWRRYRRGNAKIELLCVITIERVAVRVDAVEHFVVAVCSVCGVIVADVQCRERQVPTVSVEIVLLRRVSADVGLGKLAAFLQLGFDRVRECVGWVAVFQSVQTILLFLSFLSWCRL